MRDRFKIWNAEEGCARWERSVYTLAVPMDLQVVSTGEARGYKVTVVAGFRERRRIPHVSRPMSFGGLCAEKNLLKLNFAICAFSCFWQAVEFL